MLQEILRQWIGFVISLNSYSLSSIMNTSKITYRRTLSSDFNRCLEIRSLTRENPVSIELLEQMGITEQTWGPMFDNGSVIGVVALSDNKVIGFCSGSTETGEVLVLALLPEFENLGIGKKLLIQVVDLLFHSGFKKLWLAASPNPKIRAHGFYRYLGWKPNGRIDDQGDEILVLESTDSD